MGKPENISVSRKALEYLAKFVCEHSFSRQDSTMTCYDEDIGGVCNSCWVRNWAKEQLKKEIN